LLGIDKGAGVDEHAANPKAEHTKTSDTQIIRVENIIT
jgi:hypothetical protein